MNVQRQSLRGRCGMTLIEFLLVFVLIGLLALLLFPVTTRPRRPKILIAEVNMHSLAAAINQYEAVYNRWPIADPDTNDDITFGISAADIHGFQRIEGTRLVTNNSELIIALMDLERGMNTDHKMNPQRIVFLNSKVANDMKSGGVSSVDFPFRDPWGNPYIISLDANKDGRVRDVCYASPEMSANGKSGLLSNSNGICELRGGVMIWSRGPDGKVSVSAPVGVGVNKDNVTSWQ